MIVVSSEPCHQSLPIAAQRFHICLNKINKCNAGFKFPIAAVVYLISLGESDKYLSRIRGKSDTI